MRQTYFATLALPWLGAATDSRLDVRDSPSSLPHVTSIQYSGSGCPSSSPGVDKSGSWNDLTFRLNNYEISLANAMDNTQNCEVHLQVVGCSAGWQVGIQDVYMQGHLVLDPGADLDFYITNYWSDNAGATSTVKGTIENDGAGRIDEIATAHATIPPSRIVWSSCSSSSGDIGILNVNFRAVLRADGNQYGYFGKGGTMAATENWGYIWRRC